MEYDVIIVGAGASGLMAAIAAARHGSSVLVIEQKEKAGKKILATGNGKCNFTNMYQSPECYRSDDSAFAEKVLSCFTVFQTVALFEELGIYPKNRDGYLYPNSEQALSVLQVLTMECERLKVRFQFNEAVLEIRKPDYTVITKVLDQDLRAMDKNKKSNSLDMSKHITGNYKKSADKNINLTDSRSKAAVVALLQEETRCYKAKKLILATGGCASPKLGSDGSGYGLAKAFGHTLIKPLPALVQLKSPDKYCKTISGVRTAARVEAYADNQRIACEEGEILFTDYGISGIPVLQLSRFVAKALDAGKRVHLLLDFLPDISEEELTHHLFQRIDRNRKKNLEEMMVGLLNHKLSYIIIKEAKLDPTQSLRQLSDNQVKLLAGGLKHFPMGIWDTNSFENAQVCAGGVSTKEVNEATMESVFAKNLYLTGELLDVDGTCGGYNLQWAWTTGYLAGDAAGRK